MNPYGIFEVFGFELEYMIVDAKTLDVLAVADKVLVDAAGAVQDEIFFPAREMGWSNELAAHVLEFKVEPPAPSADGMGARFAHEVAAANALLKPLGAALMPGAAHPWMNPDREFVIWPHANREIYGAYDRIFGCKGHGWSNLQSAHINFPFRNDAEFARLHAALRVIVPLTPALTAASPYLGGTFTGKLDSRMEVYRTNSARIPEMTGLVVPEASTGRDDYYAKVFNPLYAALEPHDPAGVLRDEWANARGCIARFDRGSIELRTLSTQECPAADMAVAALVIALARALAEGKWTDTAALNRIGTKEMHGTLLATIAQAEGAAISHAPFLAAFGLSAPCTAGEVWAHVFAALQADIAAEHHGPLAHILRNGTLATRMLKRNDLRGMAGELVGCLAEGRMF